MKTLDVIVSLDVIIAQPAGVVVTSGSTVWADLEAE